MSQLDTFAEILDAAEQLDTITQAALVDVLQRRLAELGREQVADTVAQSRREFVASPCRSMTAAEIVREAQS